jgi:hypothetical protein
MSILEEPAKKYKGEFEANPDLPEVNFFYEGEEVRLSTPSASID